jgi:hypothetical protein
MLKGLFLCHSSTKWFNQTFLSIMSKLILFCISLFKCFRILQVFGFGSVMSVSSLFSNLFQHSLCFFLTDLQLKIVIRCYRAAAINALLLNKGQGMPV